MSLILLLASALAAQDVEAAETAWEPAYEQGMNLANAGVISGGVGVYAFMAVVTLILFAPREDESGHVYGHGPLSGGAAVLGKGLLVGGVVGIEAGPPLMAAGSLRAANALRGAGQPVG